MQSLRSPGKRGVDIDELLSIKHNRNSLVKIPSPEARLSRRKVTGEQISREGASVMFARLAA